MGTISKKCFFFIKKGIRIYDQDLAFFSVLVAVHHKGRTHFHRENHIIALKICAIVGAGNALNVSIVRSVKNGVDYG